MAQSHKARTHRAWEEGTVSVGNGFDISWLVTQLPQFPYIKHLAQYLDKYSEMHSCCYFMCSVAFSFLPWR